MISTETLAAAARVEAHAARRIVASLDAHSPTTEPIESRPVEAAAAPLRQSGNASNELQFLPHSPGDAAFAIRPAPQFDTANDRHASAKTGNDNLRIQSSSSL
jgi:hypothetical protein